METITITYGEDTYNVGQYSGFRVGPFSITLQIKPGEDPNAVFKRGWDILEAQALPMFLTKRNAFAEKFEIRK